MARHLHDATLSHPLHLTGPSGKSTGAFCGTRPCCSSGVLCRSNHSRPLGLHTRPLSCVHGWRIARAVCSCSLLLAGLQSIRLPEVPCLDSPAAVRCQLYKIYDTWKVVLPATQGPAYSPAWSQPQSSLGSGSSSGDVNMTLALTGPSGTALPPAAREAIQHAVAQAIPGIGALTAASVSFTDCAGHVLKLSIWLWSYNTSADQILAHLWAV